MTLSPRAQPLFRGTKMERFVRGRFIMEAKWGLTVMWMTCFTTLHSSFHPSPVNRLLCVFPELWLLFLLSIQSEAAIGQTKAFNLAALLGYRDNNFWWQNYFVGGVQCVQAWQGYDSCYGTKQTSVCMWVCVNVIQPSRISVADCHLKRNLFFPLQYLVTIGGLAVQLGVFLGFDCPTGNFELEWNNLHRKRQNPFSVCPLLFFLRTQNKTPKWCQLWLWRVKLSPNKKNNHHLHKVFKL